MSGYSHWGLRNRDPGRELWRGAKQAEEDLRDKTDSRHEDGAEGGVCQHQRCQQLLKRNFPLCQGLLWNKVLMISQAGIYVEFILVLYTRVNFSSLLLNFCLFYNVEVVREDGNFRIKYFLPYRYDVWKLFEKCSQEFAREMRARKDMIWYSAGVILGQLGCILLHKTVEISQIKLALTEFKEKKRGWKFLVVEIVVLLTQI